MAMDNLDLFPDDDISENWKEREYSWEGCFAVDDKKWYMVYFESVCQITNSFATFISMSNDDDFMASIDEFLALMSKELCGWML